MDLWKTKETHKVRKRRTYHHIKICIPTTNIQYVEDGIDKLRSIHRVPNTANIRVINIFNCWVEAIWTEDS